MGDNIGGTRLDGSQIARDQVEIAEDGVGSPVHAQELSAHARCADSNFLACNSEDVIGISRNISPDAMEINLNAEQRTRVRLGSSEPGQSGVPVGRDKRRKWVTMISRNKAPVVEHPKAEPH